jgi:uncharacterized membrane protein YphA (DoxX/SURF4 family)
MSAPYSASGTTQFGDHAFAMPAWKTILGHIAAVLTAIIFLGAGIGKIAIPYLVQQLFEQLLIPTWASMPLVITLGILETVGGILILIPRYRRWGAMLITALLIAFIGYVGIRYGALVGRDCSCFPWLKRTVNPAFFAEDGAMLVGSVAAWWLSRKPGSLRIPLMTLAGIAVISAASFGYNNMHQSGIQLPPTITVDGKPYSMREGRNFLFFYDPSCSHCDAAARHMSTYKWKNDVTVIGLPTNDPQWAASFLHDTKLVAKTSNDTAELRKLFTFSAPPYGVVVENGRVKGIIQHYDEPEPLTSLKQFGLVE